MIDGVRASLFMTFSDRIHREKFSGFGYMWYAEELALGGLGGR
jgi:hypothetical protein